eukprot:gene12333-biopygen10985
MYPSVAHRCSRDPRCSGCTRCWVADARTLASAVPTPHRRPNSARNKEGWGSSWQRGRKSPTHAHPLSGYGTRSQPLRALWRAGGRRGAASAQPALAFVSSWAQSPARESFTVWQRAVAARAVDLWGGAVRSAGVLLDAGAVLRGEGAAGPSASRRTRLSLWRRDARRVLRCVGCTWTGSAVGRRGGGRADRGHRVHSGHTHTHPHTHTRPTYSTG